MDDFENPPTLWALVEGGKKVPPSHVPPFFLLDSNAVTNLQRKDQLLSPEKEWWDTLLDDENTVLNPVPNAFEGNSGVRAPSRAAFELRFNEDVAMLRVSFPKPQVTTYDQRAFDGVYEMIETIAKANVAEDAFLVATAPLVLHAVREQDRLASESLILQIAAAHGLRSDSFSVYAILSILYAANSELQIARKILKPTSIIANKNAYNALHDISLLRMLTASIALFGNEDLPQFALLTADKFLIAFWCALEMHDFRVNEKGNAEATFSFSEALFPTLNSDERHQLSQRVAAL